MNAVAKMRQAGFGLAITERGGLWIEPASRLTTAQREFIKSHRGLLIEELRAEPANDPPLVATAVVTFDQEAYEERAAILEFDAGFSRDEAEQRALVAMAPVVDPTPVVDPLAERVAELMALGWAVWNARARASTESTAAWQTKMGAQP